MTIEAIGEQTGQESTWPGHGGREPYEIAVCRGQGILRLLDVTRGAGEPVATLDVSRFFGAIVRAEREALAYTEGAVLDVGCGPARVVHAAIDAGRLALGIDLSPASVAFAQQRGLPVLLRSVFGQVPSMGSWDTIVLLDGNIGIGGDPRALLTRCAVLLGDGGRILIETHAVAHQDTRFDAAIVDADGRRSRSFPWAQLGASALARTAAGCGLVLQRSWARNGRHFSILKRQ